jgi:hypothetical protein
LHEGPNPVEAKNTPQPKRAARYRQISRRGFVRLLIDDPAALAFFDALISLDDVR